MIVYDITDLDSFNNLSIWLDEIDKNGTKGVYKILVGNKADMDDKRKVTYDQGKEFADIHGMKFLETSAKNSYNVSDAFVNMANDIIVIQNEKEIKPKEQMKIDISATKSISKGGCCK